MVELRWVVWSDVVPVPFDVRRDSIGGERRHEIVERRKLQMRQLYDATVRAGTHSLGLSNWQWSDWKDVPEVPLCQNS